MIEYYDQLVVVPAMCEVCLAHPAVYFCMIDWPYTWCCR